MIMIMIIIVTMQWRVFGLLLVQILMTLLGKRVCFCDETELVGQPMCIPESQNEFKAFVNMGDFVL